VAFAAVATALLAACSNGGAVAPTTPASVTTAPASTTATSNTRPSNGVPPVSEPLNVSAFLAEPCKVITDPQRQALSQKGITVAPGTRDDRASVPTCIFADYQQRKKGDLFVTVFYEDKEGLSSLYDAHAKGFSPEYWSPGELTGYPVVYYTHRGSPENCDAAIATTDTSYVGIRLDRLDIFEPREQGSCAVIRPIAESVLATIRNQ
jgi:hypothetical protein